MRGEFERLMLPAHYVLPVCQDVGTGRVSTELPSPCGQLREQYSLQLLQSRKAMFHLQAFIELVAQVRRY